MTPNGALPVRRYETLVTSHEVRLFNLAVFRFLERHTCPGDGRTAAIHSFPEPAGERKAVTLWSDEATAEFASFWSRFRRSARRWPPYDA